MTRISIALVSQLTRPLKDGSQFDREGSLVQRVTWVNFKYDAELFLKWLEEDGQGGKRQVFENDPF